LLYGGKIAQVPIIPDTKKGDPNPIPVFYDPEQKAVHFPGGELRLTREGPPPDLKGSRKAKSQSAAPGGAKARAGVASSALLTPAAIHATTVASNLPGIRPNIQSQLL